MMIPRGGRLYLKLKPLRCIQIQLMSQFTALLLKNLTLYRRSWCCSFMELIVIFGVAIMMLVLRKLVDVEPQVETSFIGNNNYTIYLLPPFLSQVRQIMMNCTNKKIALSPRGDPIIMKLNTRLTELDYETQFFDNPDQLTKHIQDPAYGIGQESICFGVTMDSSSNSNYTYRLWFGITTWNMTTQGPRTDKEATVLNPFSRTNFQPLILSGMAGVQNLLHNYILQYETDNPNAMMGGQISPMRQEAYDYDDFGVVVYEAFDFMLTFPIIVIYLRMTGLMMMEKQRKIKEVMKVMGMTNTSYYGSWILHEFLVFLVASIFNAGMIKATLPRVDFFVVLLLYVLYSLVLISQSLFIQVFFTRAKIAVLCATFFFGIQQMMVFLFKNSQNQTLKFSSGVSVSPIAGVSLALLAMVQHHSTGLSVNFGNITEPMNQIKISTVFVWQFVNIIVWFLLFLYLQQVFPNEWGAKKHPFFIFKWLRKLCSKKSVANSAENDLNINGNTQAEIIQGTPNSVDIIQLTKIYEGSDRKSLDNLTIRMIKGQIFCLLGHNGAGKTTTVGILTGMHEPTSGRVSVFGSDLVTRLDRIRKIMGYCPQHNTLYDELTVEEHLRLFGRFKGFTGVEAEHEIDQLLRDMKLTDKRHALSSTLSGGQKRRLSVGMAFAGGSELVFLDEPTSGVDTSARRDIWQLLKQYRENRVIVLTTHFMDEADHLADSTAILNNGKLVRCGTTFELKQQERMGYTLTIAKKTAQTNTQRIMGLVKLHVKDAVLESGVGMQMVIRLPVGKERQMTKLFVELQDCKSKEDLEMESYGINVASLQEIFIAATDHQENETILTEKEKDRENELKKAQQDLCLLPPLLSIDQPANNFLKQFSCTFLKRGKLSIRDWKTLLFEFAFPIILCTLVIVLIKVNALIDMPIQNFSDNLFAGQYPLKFPLASDPSIGFSISKLVSYINENQHYEAKAYNNVLNITSFDRDVLFPIKSPSLKGGVYFQQASTLGSAYQYYMLVNTKSGASPFMLSSKLTEAIIYSQLNKRVTINAINNPIPLTYSEKSHSPPISGYIGAVGFALAVSFKFASVISMIVKEREERCKHQQKISGLRLTAYWSANLVFDFLTYLPIAILIGGLCHAFNLQDFVGEASGATWAALIIYAPANLLFTYFLSFAYENHEVAMAMHYFTNFILTGLIPAIIMVLRAIGSNSSLAGRGIAWALRLLPPYSFGEVLINLARKPGIQWLENGGNPLPALSWPVTSPAIIYMGVLTLIYGLSLFVLEWVQNSTASLLNSKKQEGASPAPEPDSAVFVNSLKKTYRPWKLPEVEAISGLDLNIKRGEVYGMLGANGAGKSTLYKILTGETHPTEGEVFLMGQTLSEARSQLWKVIGYCPQFDALFDTLTVREHLDHYYQLKNIPAQHQRIAVDAQIGMLGLRKYENIAADKLSGGNKRRLSLAIALIGEPPILLLDEASTGMDPLSRRLLWNVVAKAPRSGYTPTVLLTTHSMQEAEVLSNRLTIMAGGRLQCEDTPQNIKERFHAGYEIDVRFIVTEKQVDQRCTQVNELPEHRVTEAQYQRFVKELVAFEQKELSCNEFGVKQQQSGLQAKLDGLTGRQLRSKIVEDKIILKELVKFIMITKLIVGLEASHNNRRTICEVVESFGLYCCLRLEGDVILSQLFEQLQEKKYKGMIQEYSIKQGSIEHIFNRLVEKQQEEEQIDQRENEGQKGKNIELDATVLRLQ